MYNFRSGKVLKLSDVENGSFLFQLTPIRFSFASFVRSLARKRGVCFDVPLPSLRSVALTRWGRKRSRKRYIVVAATVSRVGRMRALEDGPRRFSVTFFYLRFLFEEDEITGLEENGGRGNFAC